VEIVEKHIELNPDDARALYLGGGSLLILGERERGLDWGRRALAIDPRDPLILYNVACLFAQAREDESAIETLGKAMDAGFGHRKWVEHDSDLDPLRDHPRFQELLARL